MFNWIVSDTYQYLETFNCVQKNELQLIQKYKQNVFTNPIDLIYMYKEDLALNNLQWLICHKTQPNQIIYI